MIPVPVCLAVLALMAGAGATDASPGGGRLPDDAAGAAAVAGAAEPATAAAPGTERSAPPSEAGQEILIAPESLGAVERSSAWLLAAGAALFLATLPRGLGVLLGATLAGTNWALTVVNQTKVDLTQAPLTALDFRIALANPAGLWAALRWPYWTLWLAGGVAVLTLAFAAALAVRALIGQRHSWHHGHRRPRVWAGAVALGLTLGMAAFSGSRLAVRAAANPSLWEARGLAEYSTVVGIVPFLLMSYQLESDASGVFHDDVFDGAPLAATELRHSSARQVAPSPRGRLLPNIVVLFGESTFNPDWAFRLRRPVSSPLFAAHDDTVMLSPLHVNTIGGGSWIEEFESLIGIDARMFGYSGFYTHATLAPFVRRTLVSYLNDRGYDTAAYYAWQGEFYNARRAFHRYGFEAFHDGADLGLNEAATDRTIAATALQRVSTLQKAPFFSFVSLTENHAPHPCEHFSGFADFATVFETTAGLTPNCELNEYVRRLDSTWDAFETWQSHLRALEASSGRPYVLMMFGDHQPHTFTATGGQTVDYRPYRTRASLRETFVHVRSSLAGVIRCCQTSPPVTLLPSLLSAFVAADLDQLYLPENFYLFERCGSNLLGGEMTMGIDARPGTGAARDFAECTSALDRALPSLRAAGVF